MRSLSTRAARSMILLTAASLPALAEPTPPQSAKDKITAPTATSAPAPQSPAKPANITNAASPNNSTAAAAPKAISASPDKASRAAANQPAAAVVAAKAPEKKKPLHTVPEDGTGLDEIWTPSKWVRELLEKRPNEDLIICIAGCFSNRDKVVYAQLIEHRLQPAPAVAETPAVPQPNAPAEVQPTSVTPAAEEKSSPANPELINAKPTAGDDVMPADASHSKSEMVPAMAEPEGAASSDAKPNAPNGAADKTAEDKPKPEPEAAPPSEEPAPQAEEPAPGESSDAPSDRAPAEAAPSESGSDGEPENPSPDAPQPESP